MRIRSLGVRVKVRRIWGIGPRAVARGRVRGIAVGFRVGTLGKGRASNF